MIDYEGLILDQAEMLDNGECPSDDCEHCPYIGCCSRAERREEQ